jgi:hypothetical protein
MLVARGLAIGQHSTRLIHVTAHTDMGTRLGCLTIQIVDANVVHLVGGMVHIVVRADADLLLQPCTLAFSK